MLAGQPLAIEYNQAVLQDKPENSDEAYTDRYQGSASNKTHKQGSAVAASKSSAEGTKQHQPDGFFITEDLNQQDGDNVEMVA